MYSRKKFNQYEAQLYHDINDGIAAIEALIKSELKETRESAKALTRLDEALMWAGAAIAAGVKRQKVTKDHAECPADPKECPLCALLKEMETGEVKTIEIRD